MQWLLASMWHVWNKRGSGGIIIVIISIINHFQLGGVTKIANLIKTNGIIVIEFIFANVPIKAKRRKRIIVKLDHWGLKQRNDIIET